MINEPTYKLLVEREQIIRDRVSVFSRMAKSEEVKEPDIMLEFAEALTERLLEINRRLGL